MGKKSPEDNSAQAAASQGQYALKQSEMEARENRVNQYNPFGSSTWSNEWQRDANGEIKRNSRGAAKLANRVQTTSLNPEYQKILDRQTGLLGQQQEAQSGMLDNMLAQGPSNANQYSMSPEERQQYGMIDLSGQSMDPGSIRSEAQDAAYQYQTNRLDPQMQRQQEQMEIKLRSQGLRPGDAAYDSQVESFGNTRNDAYEQARLGSYAEGRQEAGQMFDQRNSMIQNEMLNRQQGFSRDLESREQAIQAYLKDRGQTLGEFQSVDPTATAGGLVDTFGGA